MQIHYAYSFPDSVLLVSAACITAQSLADHEQARYLYMMQHTHDVVSTCRHGAIMWVALRPSLSLSRSLFLWEEKGVGHCREGCHLREVYFKIISRSNKSTVLPLVSLLSQPIWLENAWRITTQEPLQMPSGSFPFHSVTDSQTNLYPNVHTGCSPKSPETWMSPLILMAARPGLTSNSRPSNELPLPKRDSRLPFKHLRQ